MITDRFFTANDGNGELELPSDSFVAPHTKDRTWSTAMIAIDKLTAVKVTDAANHILTLAADSPLPSSMCLELLPGAGWRCIAVGQSKVGGDTEAAMQCIGKAKDRCKLDPTAKVHSYYEAGRDGWWLHRWLVEQDIDNIVVDSSSIEVNRHARRTKSDQIDGNKLLSMLLRHRAGERVWSALHEPTACLQKTKLPAGYPYIGFSRSSANYVPTILTQEAPARNQERL
jgi:hypothetical protein